MIAGGEPNLIPGDVAVDDRGTVAFVNGFGFEGVRRFYMVANHRQGFVRAWHAHRHEAKYVSVVRGSCVLGAVRIDDWESPSKEAQVHKYVLSSAKPSILYIPPGYANGFMSLTEDAQIIFYSTASMEEARHDDIRYDARYWDIWPVVER